MSNTVSEIAGLRAALAAAEIRAEVAESEPAQTRAVVSCSEAMIQELRLEIARLRRDKYGISSERRARLTDQLELQLEELETAATEDTLAAEQAAEKASTVRAFTRRHPVRKPFPDHLPRERVVVEAPAACTCCGPDRLMKMGEEGEPLMRHWFEHNGERDAGGDPAAVEGDPDRAREVHLPGLRKDQPAAGPVPCDPARMGRAQPDRHARLREIWPAPAAEPAGRTLRP